MRAALGEGAEAATEIADVGVVDVAIDDVAHDVAADRLTQGIGGAGDMAVVGIACREQAHDLGMVEPLAGGRAVDDAGDLRIDLARQDLRRGRRLGIAGRPVIVARKAFGVAHAPHLRGDLGGEPGVGRAGIGGIDREPVDQQLAHVGGEPRQLGEDGPRRLGIHMVGRHRRNAAPIVQAGADQARIDAGRQVGRRLDVHVRPEDLARDSDGP